MDLLTDIPDTIVAGTTTTYTLSVPDYPATDGWTLSLILSGPAPNKLTTTAAASGADYAVTITAAAATALTPGLYAYAHRVTKAGVVHQVSDGRITVAPDIANAAAGSLACWEELALVQVRAAILQHLTENKSRFQIAGRAVERPVLVELRKTEVWLCARLRAKRGGAEPMQTIGIAFTGEGSEG